MGEVFLGEAYVQPPAPAEEGEAGAGSGTLGTHWGRIRPCGAQGVIRSGGRAEAAELAPTAARTCTHPLRLGGKGGEMGWAWGGGFPPTVSLLWEGTEKKELNVWKLKETWGTSPLPANPSMGSPATRGEAGQEGQDEPLNIRGQS